jgi:hypothetical protein
VERETVIAPFYFDQVLIGAFRYWNPVIFTKPTGMDFVAGTDGISAATPWNKFVYCWKGSRNYGDFRFNKTEIRYRPDNISEDGYNSLKKEKRVE